MQDTVLHKQKAFGKYPNVFQRHAADPTKRAMTIADSRQR